MTNGDILIGIIRNPNADKQVNTLFVNKAEYGGYAYHGQDGKIYKAVGDSKQYGPKFATGDVITINVNMDNGKLSFSKNNINACLLYTSPSPRDRG